MRGNDDCNYSSAAATADCAADGRVDPANSRKMAARLQEATSSGLPILLWTSPSAVHGFGTALDEQIAELTDRYAFLFAELGVQYRSVGQTHVAVGRELRWVGWLRER